MGLFNVGAHARTVSSGIIEPLGAHVVRDGQGGLEVRPLPSIRLVPIK
jgi:hypothetical protein